MKLSYFTMPIHPVDKPVSQTLKEDREAFLLADKLGFAEGYCGEHTTDLSENVASAIAFVASLAYQTENIRLGTGTVNLPNNHPAAVAAQVSMLDHMLEGRFNFGISPGGLLSDAEIFGNLEKDRNAMFVEVIDMVLELWKTDAPYNLKGEFWELSTARTMMPEIGQGCIIKPFQKPHPPIIVTVVAPYSKGMTAAAARGWDPISANFLLPKWVATHWPNYFEGCEAGGRTADPRNWRIAKSIFVAESEATAREYARGPKSPYVFYYDQILTKMKMSGRANLFKEDQGMPDDAVTLDYVCDRLITYGTPESVTDQLLKFHEEVGDFGHIVYAGHDWSDPGLARTSMRLMAEKVLPAINDAIGGSRRAAAQ